MKKSLEKSPYHGLSTADKIYYGLAVWGLLRRDSLLKLINISSQSWENDLKKKPAPMRNAGPLLFGQSIPTCFETADKCPCGFLRGDFFYRNGSYTPEVRLPLNLKEIGSYLHDDYPPAPSDNNAHFRQQRMLRLNPTEKRTGGTEKPWAANRHNVWCGQLAAELNAHMDYFLPGFVPKDPFAVVPEIFMRKVLHVRSTQMQLFERNEDSPTAPDPKWEAIKNKIEQLRHLPDALFFSTEGSFFLEIEASQKLKGKYETIFDYLKKTNWFILYIIKDRQGYELPLNAEEWMLFPEITDRHVERIRAGYARQVAKQRSLPIDDFSGGDSVSDKLIDELYKDRKLSNHLAFLRIDRREHFATDRMRAAERLNRHFSQNLFAYDNDLSRLFDDVAPLFCRSWKKGSGKDCRPNKSLCSDAATQDRLSK